MGLSLNFFAFSLVYTEDFCVEFCSESANSIWNEGTK